MEMKITTNRKLVPQRGPLNGLLVRKEAKDHGTGQFVEGLGNFKPGDKVAMLEDVVTTGGSLLKACDRVRAQRQNHIPCP